MSSTKVTIPDLRFGFYYPEIVAALLEYKRTFIPELSDESEFEPSIQLLRAFALVGHNNNVVMDMLAQEGLLDTAQLAESVRKHLKLIGYDMAPARPAQAELLMRLSKQFGSSTTIAPSGTLVSTERDQDTNVSIFFETDEQVSVTATDAFTKVIAFEGGIATDFTAKANSTTTPGDDWTPWASVAAGDSIYVGHDSVMFDRIDTFATIEVDTGVGFGVWEYYNGDFEKAAPDLVEQSGNKLIVYLNGYLGETSRAGATVRVQLNSTTVSQDATVIWTGTANVVEVGLLGQSTVSLDVADYTIGSDWDALPSLASTSGVGDILFGKDEDQITFSLPQSITENWAKTTVESHTAYWIRFRWIEAAATGPTMQYLSMAEASQYVIVGATQGQTGTDSPLASSTGEPNQIYTFTRDHLIDDSNIEITVDATAWTRVDNFISSGPSDEHYVIQLTGADDTGQVKFGDGERGKIPPAGVSNIVATYRYGGENDGNVGASTITKDRTSLNFVASISNPRQATGWSAAEGATAESLALAKQIGPVLARTKGVAVSADDLVPLTLRYVSDAGASPFSRAFAIEEAFGPKTVELVVVAKGGGLATSDQLAELQLFYNGDKNAIPPVVSHFTANQKVTATNYTQKSIDIVAKVKATDVTAIQIENALRAVFDPEAIADDGVTYEWDFGETVARSRIDHEIHKVSSSITEIELVSPASNVALSFRELPKAGSISIEIVSP